MKPSAVIKAFLAITFWGASFVATKVALREASPLTVIVLRFAMGLMALALVGRAAILVGVWLVNQREAKSQERGV